MIVYFAAVNQTHFCEAFRGNYILESFMDSRPLFGRYRATFKSMALDCGAYSAAVRSGRQEIDLHKYAEFVTRHGGFYDFCASVDSIAGGAEENLRNWQFFIDRNLETMPTFHQGEPLSILKDYCSRARRVGLGFQRNEEDGRPVPGSKAFLDTAFAVIPRHVKVHGWAMTNFMGDYPFTSVDSRTWLFELKALRVAQTTQRRAFDHLTDSELIEIIQKRYERLPRMEKWRGSSYVEDLLG